MSEDAQVQPPAESRRAVSVVWLLVLHSAALLGLLAILAVVLPKFQEIFRSFGMRLPFLTILTFNVVAFLQKNALLLMPLFGGLLALDTWAYTSIVRAGRNDLARVWLWAWPALGVAAILLAVLSVLLPLAQLMQAVTKTAGSGG